LNRFLRRRAGADRYQTRCSQPGSSGGSFANRESCGLIQVGRATDRSDVLAMIGAFSTHSMSGRFASCVDGRNSKPTYRRSRSPSEFRLSIRHPIFRRVGMSPRRQPAIVRYDAKAGSRTLDLMRWGLVPYWAKDIKVGFSTSNAMAETIDTKPVFREAFQHRRCIVPVDNFYEWKKLGPKEKQPYAIALADLSLMALAGLWETWRSPAQRDDPVIPDRHHDTKRAMRPTPQSDACDPAGRDVDSVARRGTH